MQEEEGRFVKIVWLSDLHFEAQGLVLGHDPRVRLKAAVAFVAAHLADADLCLVTGDVVETATAANYAAVAEVLNHLPMPVCVMPGNHDDRYMMRTAFAFPGQVMDGFAQTALDLGDAVVLCLDGLVPGADHGVLCDVRLDWLRARLRDSAGRPVIVALHHPPVAIGLPMLDPDNLQNGSALLGLLAGHDAPVQVLAGHVHRSCSAFVDGIAIRTQRAVLYQAPGPVPAWDWESFAPAHEAPVLGLVTLDAGQITVQDLQFCPYEQGGASI